MSLLTEDFFRGVSSVRRMRRLNDFLLRVFVGFFSLFFGEKTGNWEAVWVMFEFLRYHTVSTRSSSMSCGYEQTRGDRFQTD